MPVTLNPGLSSSAGFIQKPEQMKAILLRLILLCLAITGSRHVFSQANAALSNLANTAVNVDLLPGGDNAQNLGSAAKSWKILYLDRHEAAG